VPPGATLVFSAHGVSKAVRVEAAQRGFQVFDATCPLVTKVHVEVAKLAKEGFEFIMIGHKGHPEVEGTMGQLSEGIYLVEDVPDVAHVQPRGDKLAVVTQTTLSVDDAAAILAEVKRLFPHVREPKQQDICYATQNRQDAVKVLAPKVDVVIVVGSPTSSNSSRLRELAERLGVSRTPVREALQRLETQSMLTRDGRSLIVASLDHNQLAELYAVRTELEGLAARLAAAIRTQRSVRSSCWPIWMPIPRW